MSVNVDSGLDAIPSAVEVARGAVFLEGPRGLLVSWFLIGAFVIVSSSVGLVGMLLLLPLVALMIAVGVVWLLVRGVRQ